MKKTVCIDKRADKEIKKFPSLIQAKTDALFRVLARDGQLNEPFNKKLDNELFEIRIKHQGQWRILYAYIVDEFIIILSAFVKKTQKTPLDELRKAKQRLKEYKI
jgi:phage-related protein